MQASRKTSNQTNISTASQKSQANVRPSSPPPAIDRTARPSAFMTGTASMLQQSRGPMSRAQAQESGGSDRWDLEEQAEDVLEEPFVDEPYQPPPTNFVRVLHGDQETLVLNTGCRSQIFLDHLRDKLLIKIAWVSLDLCTEDGALLGLNKLEPNDHIRQLVKSGEQYIPCVLLRDETGCLAKIKPRLKKWRKLYPHFEEVFNQAIIDDQEVVRQRHAQEAATSSARKSKEPEQTQEQLSEKKKKGKKLSNMP